MKSLIETAREYLSTPLTIEEEVQLNEGAFLRLPGHVIGNELYVVTKELKSFTDSQMNGSDFNEKAFDKIIKTLKDICLEAKRFNSEDEVPVSYKYKK